MRKKSNTYSEDAENISASSEQHAYYVNVNPAIRPERSETELGRTSPKRLVGSVLKSERRRNHHPWGRRVGFRAPGRGSGVVNFV